MDEKRFHRLHAECRRIIGSLRSRKAFPPSDCDDLEQEMALALLQMEGQSDAYCLTRAAWAALMWLRRTHGGRTARAIGRAAGLRKLIDSGAWRRVWC